MEQLKKYCMPAKSSLIIGFIICTGILLGTGIFFLMAVSLFSKGKFKIIFDLVVILIYYLAYYISYGRFKKQYNKSINYFKSANTLDSVLWDFSFGKHIFSDSVIMGQYCIIVNERGIILSYRQIEHIDYNRCSKTDEDGRNDGDYCKVYIRADGKKYKIADIPDTQSNINQIYELKQHFSNIQSQGFRP